MNFYTEVEESLGKCGSNLILSGLEDIAAGLGQKSTNRVTSLDNGVELASSGVIEAVGNLTYVSDVDDYPEYNLTSTGWYVFARIQGKAGEAVDSNTTISGAEGYIATTGESYVDVAVRFDVAAISKTVTVTWGERVDKFTFKATDLAIRNLDYRVTFYVYDASPFVTWEYTPATDATFAAGKYYYSYDGAEYLPANVTVGDAIEKYYTKQTTYTETQDETFVEGKTYYILVDDEYLETAYTAGDTVAEQPDTYYEGTTTYVQAAGEFEDGVTYYTYISNEYLPANVTVGDAIPSYYVHSKITIEGLPRNVTYRLDEIIDCPMEFILPEIEDETHGCWFEIRCQHAGEYSMTLVPPSPDIKIATEHTQKEKAGINMINLHYTVINNTKIWRFLNTCSTIPA